RTVAIRLNVAAVCDRRTSLPERSNPLTLRLVVLACFFRDLTMKKNAVRNVVLAICLLHSQQQLRRRERNRYAFNVGNFHNPLASSKSIPHAAVITSTSISSDTRTTV